MIIKLPYPDSNLMPNKANGKHWTQTSKLKAEAKLAAYMLTKSALATQGVNLGESVPLMITFAQSDKRHRDLDGLLSASKAHLDGVADALKINDRQFQPVTIKRAYVEFGSSTIVEVG